MGLQAISLSEVSVYLVLKIKTSEGELGGDRGAVAQLMIELSSKPFVS